MKKLFLTLGAVLTIGIASAQVNSQGTVNTAGQINKPSTGTNNNTLARPAEMSLNKSANASQSAVPVGQNSNTNGISSQTPSAAPTMSTSGAGGGSTVNTSSVPNTANTTNATTTQVPDKKKNN